uniref:Uncharacterized protein n=1 Tax=Rhizophora mucronata TaxID=61149 RepID=A0A2P2QCY6_RHIMU
MIKDCFKYSYRYIRLTIFKFLLCFTLACFLGLLKYFCSCPCLATCFN